MINPVAQIGASLRLGAVTAALRPQNSREQETAQLRKACCDFESLLLRILLREMRKTVPEGGVFTSSAGMGMYREIADDYFAVKLAESGGLGLGDTLFREFQRVLAARTPADAPQTD